MIVIPGDTSHGTPVTQPSRAPAVPYKDDDPHAAAPWSATEAGETMIAMHMYMVGAALLAVALMVGIGVAGITTGWVPPWARRRVLRPKLTGYGALTGGIGMAMYLFLGPWGGYPSDGLRGAVAWCGWGLFMAGLLLQLLGQRPGRTR